VVAWHTKEAEMAATWIVTAVLVTSVTAARIKVVFA
jgi:hypothetical protein